jgi:hypothetical protein
MEEDTFYIAKYTDFVKVGNEYYLPRPTGWMQGLARHLWFEKLVGVKPTIASPRLWGNLIKENNVQRLTETSKGAHEITREQNNPETKEE